MPSKNKPSFKNKGQMKACFAKYNQDVKDGVHPSWDCYEWLKNTPKKIKYINGKKSRNSRNGKKSRNSRNGKKSRNSRNGKKSDKTYHIDRLVRIGPRGGRYILYKNRKMYI